MDSLLQCGVSVKKQFLGGTAIPERSSELPSRLEALGKGHDEPFLFLFLKII